MHGTGRRWVGCLARAAISQSTRQAEASNIIPSVRMWTLRLRRRSRTSILDVSARLWRKSMSGKRRAAAEVAVAHDETGRTTVAWIVGERGRGGKVRRDATRRGKCGGQTSRATRTPFSHPPLSQNPLSTSSCTHSTSKTPPFHAQATARGGYPAPPAWERHLGSTAPLADSLLRTRLPPRLRFPSHVAASGDLRFSHEQPSHHFPFRDTHASRSSKMRPLTPLDSSRLFVMLLAEPACFHRCGRPSHPTFISNCYFPASAHSLSPSLQIMLKTLLR